MSSDSNKLSCYVLRLERESVEYRDGTDYKHFWNEIFEIAEGADETSRGERIHMTKVCGDVIEFTFYDEKTPSEGVEGIISFDSPNITLRHDVSRGGCNEFAWYSRDLVTVKLDKAYEDELHAKKEKEKKNEMDARWDEAEKLFGEDEAAAFKIFEELCEAGHPRSAHSVGWCYREGRGVEQDLSRAVEYYSLAINRGFPSYTSLATTYEMLGDTENEIKALECGVMMDDAGSYLGLSLKAWGDELYGGNTRIVADLAARAYELDANHGDMLAICYMNGIFLPQVYPYAKYCFEKAGYSKEDIIRAGLELPEYWDEVEPIAPSYPDFHISMNGYSGAFDPEKSYDRAMDLLYGDQPNESGAQFQLKLAAECGYYKAIRSAFYNNVYGYMAWLETGAFKYGDFECIAMLASILGDEVKYCVGDPVLNKVVKLWNLKEKLHKHRKLEGIMLGCYNNFRENFDKMMEKK